MTIFLRFTLATLAGMIPLVLPASEVTTAAAIPLRRAEINAALERTDLPAAWNATRAWIEAAPQDPAARLAEAELYLRLNAPAAAIASAGAGLAALTEKNRPLERPLLALKAQAHAAIGEHAPAWAAFSRLIAQAGSNPQADPLVATARRARWGSYAELSSGDEYGRFLERITAAAQAADAPLAARMRLAYWVAHAQQPTVALKQLLPLLLAPSPAEEVRTAFADIFLWAAQESDGIAGLQDLSIEYRDALEVLRKTGTDPLGLWALDALQQMRAPEPEVERQAPRDAVALAQTFLKTLPERRARMLTRVTAATKAVEAGQAALEDLTTEAPFTVFVAWEKRQLPAVQELQAALAELTKLEDAADYLASVLEERAEAPTGTAAEKQALAQVQKLVPCPEAQRTAMGSASEAVEQVRQAALGRRVDRRAAAGRAWFGSSGSPADELAATDTALAFGDYSPAMWRRRRAAATALRDRAESLASGARAFIAEWFTERGAPDREMPATTAQLLAELEQEVAGAESLVASATTAWESGKAEQAFTFLDQALQVDSALPAVWRLRWQWCEAGGDLAGAAFALERWWRLDDSTPYDRSTAFNIASRAGAWQLLLSLADARLAVEPTDTEAICFRAHAAFACNRLSVARSSLPLLRISTQANAAVMLDVALACLDPKNGNLTPGYTINSLVGTPKEPAGLTELLGCYEFLKRGPATVAAKPAAPGATPSPAAIHLERLEGRIAPADYVARTRGTPQEAMADFVVFFLGTREGLSPEARERAAALSADARLPLAVRTYAHRLLVVAGAVQPGPALRASDLYYASAAPATAPWGAPGQEVFVEKNVKAADIPADLPVRLRGPADASVTVTLLSAPALKEPTNRLWELRTVTASGDFYGNARNQKPVLQAHMVRFARSELKAAGALRLENCDFSSVVLDIPPGGAATLRDPSGQLNRTTVAGAFRIEGGELDFFQVAQVAATGRAEVQGTRLTGPLPFYLKPGGQAVWRDVLVYSTDTWPEQLPAGWTVQGARIQALPKDRSKAVFALPEPHRGTVYVIAPRQAIPTLQVKTMKELQDALPQAKPGDVIQIGPGNHGVGYCLELPPGVSLYATPGATFHVNTATDGAFRLSRPGAVRTIGVLSAVAANTTTIGGNQAQLQDDHPKTAITVGRDGWFMAEAGSYYGWHHRAHQLARVEAGGRLEFHRHEVTDKVFIDPKGELWVSPPAYDPAGKLLTAIRQRTREDEWRGASTRFTQAIARSTSRPGREEAARVLAQAMGDTAQRTGAGQAESTRALMVAIVPTLERYPAESPQIFGSTHHYNLSHDATVRAMMPNHLLSYFKTFSASFDRAQSIGLNKVSTDNIYDLMLAYPPGSPHYAAARSAMERNLTPAQLQGELAAKQQREAELAKQMKAAAARALEEAKRAKTYSNTTSPSSGSSSGSSSWSSRSYSAPSYTPPPSWTPSESYKMQIYRHNLDVQIYKATRGY